MSSCDNKVHKGFDYNNFTFPLIIQNKKFTMEFISFVFLCGILLNGKVSVCISISFFYSVYSKLRWLEKLDS